MADPQTPPGPSTTYPQPPIPPQSQAWYQNPKLHSALDLAQKIVFIVGIPIGIYNYIDGQQKDHRDRERATYEKLDDRYWDYIKLGISNPTLHVTDASNDPKLRKFIKDRSQLTAEEKIKGNRSASW
jgi:hypothetical protein